MTVKPLKNAEVEVDFSGLELLEPVSKHKWELLLTRQIETGHS